MPIDFSKDGGPLRADSSECVSPSGSSGVRDALVIVSFILSNVVQTLWIVGLSTMRHGLVIPTDDGYVHITLVQLLVAYHPLTQVEIVCISVILACISVSSPVVISRLCV